LTLAALADWVTDKPRLLVLTGAGCSTGSGIPEYRDDNGDWKHRRPVPFADFVASERVRRRYWARSLVGFARMSGARPNPAHLGLARLEQAGFVRSLVTQNVDGLHQRAGSRAVLDLHGRIDSVVCLDCGGHVSRADLQELLVAWNPRHAGLTAAATPDGDAALEGDFDDFRVPDCPCCGGMLKPDVVLFGENVPRPRVDSVLEALAGCDALLVVGSSLMVFSGYRFCLAARAIGKPVAAINRGKTRADDLFDLKLETDCGDAVATLAERLAGGHPH
jgi:NAD-dependent SIR2 family protein deacetylase